MVIVYGLVSLLLSILSWGFVDANSPYPVIGWLYKLIHIYRGETTTIYVILFASLFVLYIWTLGLIHLKKITFHTVLFSVVVTTVLLFFGFPGLSYDVFNYMATAKVSFMYHENPYIVMPVELTGEPMLSYMHAANKIALYGPVWIALTIVPYLLGQGYPLLTLYLFKLVAVGFYILTLWFIWKLSNKNLWAIVFFGLNPIVLSETILSAHNDIVMMAFILGAFYLLQRKRYAFSVVALILSVGIKYATIFIVPIYMFAMVSDIQNSKRNWQKIWLWNTCAMHLAFILSPLREEIYSWYFIWPLTFLSFLPGESILVWASYGFTFGLPYRFAPFVYWREWTGLTPLIKKIVTITFPALCGTYGYFKNR